MPDWFDYQELAAAIYRDLSPGAVVTHDDHILGLTSGIKRQIDVSIRADLGGHAMLIVVQAKDLGRPADLNVVGEFKAVVDDVRASKGVLICSGGFTATAIGYAKDLNIDLCTVHEAASCKWSLDLRIPLLWVESTIDFELELMARPRQTNTESIALDPDAGTWLLSRDGGATAESVSQILCTNWDTPAMSRLAGVQHRLELPCDGLELRFGNTYWCPLESFAFVYTIRNLGWKGTVTFAQCRGILNVSTGILRAKVRLTDKDIPLQRASTWDPVEDLAAFEAANPHLLRIERSAPSPHSLNVDRMHFEQG
jgi:restriction endonuclease